jgi:hypothetical protein
MPRAGFVGGDGVDEGGQGFAVVANVLAAGVTSSISRWTLSSRTTTSVVASVATGAPAESSTLAYMTRWGACVRTGVVVATSANKAPAAKRRPLIIGTV